jgi:hypothetical protein
VVYYGLNSSLAARLVCRDEAMQDLFLPFISLLDRKPTDSPNERVKTATRGERDLPGSSSLDRRTETRGAGGWEWRTHPEAVAVEHGGVYGDGRGLAIHPCQLAVRAHHVHTHLPQGGWHVAEVENHGHRHPLGHLLHVPLDVVERPSVKKRPPSCGETNEAQALPDMAGVALYCIDR